MSDDRPPLNGSPQPFARRQVTWGRPPATTFRAGPLPKGEALPPLPEPPPARPAQPAAAQANFFSGSMIPRAAPQPKPAPALAKAPTPALAPTPKPAPR